MKELRDFRERLRARLAELIETRTVTLADGAVSNHEQYRRIVGEIAGLKDALVVMDEAYRQMLEHDEDDPG